MKKKVSFLERLQSVIPGGSHTYSKGHDQFSSNAPVIINKGKGAYLFDYLTWNESGLVYAYMGKQAQEWSEAVNDNNYKFFVSHPASAAYNKQERWNSDNLFVKINEVVERQFNAKITW